MTTTLDEPDVDAAGELLPPRHYPHRDWADDPADPYHVPPELRADYAAAEPSEREVTAFWSSGAVRILHLGWDAMVAYAREHGAITPDEAARLSSSDYTASMYQKLVAASARVKQHSTSSFTEEGEPVPKGMMLGVDTAAFTFVVREYVEGPEGFVEWIHGERYERAEQAVARRRVKAEREARRAAAAALWRREHTCPCCGAVSGDDLLSVAAPGPLASRTRLCALCRGHAERIILDAETVNGRPRRELVTDYLDQLTREDS